MKAMNKIKDLDPGTDKIVMECKKNLQLRQLKLKFSVKMPIMLTGDVRRFNSLWMGGC
jgi:hypothetical protein